MTRSPLRLGFALAAVLALCLLPLLSLPAAAAPSQPARTHLSPPPPPPPGGHTYFYCNWLGNWVRLKHIPNVSVERLKDAVVVGKCQSLRTNDRFYKRLVGHSINVFFAPREYPGVLVVHNGRQGFQPVFGTWTLPLSGSASATLSGTVTDSVSGAAIAGATVTAKQCIAAPTEHCTIHTVVTDAGGKYTIQFFQFGKWDVTATADGYATGGSVTQTITKNKKSILNIALVRQPVNLTLNLGVTPSPGTVNSPETVSVTLSQPVNDGTVNFSASGTATGSFNNATCTPSAGTCSVTWTPSTAGTATITAKWSGDTLYNPASNTAQVTVNGLSTTLTLTAAPSPATTGQTVTLTALLGTSANGGTVSFTGTGPSGSVFPTQTCTPAAGSCSITWQASAPGTWSISAQWSGSGAYGPATGTTTLVVNPSSATMTLTANPNSTTVGGQSVTLTAQLSVPVNDGTIVFSATSPAGTTSTLQSCPPTAGACTVTWNPPSPGTWTVRATWSGDAQYPSGAQATTLVNVTGGTISISLTAVPNPASVNSPVRLTATLTQPVNDGTILFTGTGPNGASFPQQSCVPVPSGNTASCYVYWTPTVAGTWQISAFWSGDTQYQSPQVATINVTVSANAATVTVSANPNPVTVSHGTTVTATLAGGASGGSISFTGTGPGGQAATISPATCVPTNGQCSVTFVPSTAGTWTITANWSGNPPQYGASSGSTTVTATAAGAFSVTEVPNPLQVNNTGTVTATVQTPQTGQVTFTGTGPNGQTYSASCTLTNSTSCTANFTPRTIGTWTITGVLPTATQTYTDTDQVAVVGAASSVNLQVNPSPPAVNQPATITATVTPAVSDGQVTFSGSGPNGQTFSPSSTTCVPAGGSCYITWTPPVAGTWTITASWSGDNTYAPSPPKTITVIVGSGIVSISTSPSPPTAGQQTTLTAQLTITPTTTTTITWTGTGPNGQNLANYIDHNTCAIYANTNSCSVNWTPNAPGPWTIRASWSGDSAHPNGDQTTATITVQAAFFSVSVTPTPPEPLNTQVYAIAQFADPTINDGTVYFTFLDPNNNPYVVQCSNWSNGTCQGGPVTANVAGTWTVTAQWSGDTQNPSGATATTQFTVNNT